MNSRWFHIAVTVVLLASAFLLWRAWTADSPAPVVEPSRSDAEPAMYGRVLDSDGEPVKGASVRVWRKEREAEGKVAVTDAAGAYAFPTLDEGRWRVDASAEGLMSPGPAALRAVIVDIDDEISLEVDLQLRRAATLQGSVLNGTKGLADVVLDVAQQGCEGVGGPLDEFSFTGAAKTEANGSFRLQVAPCATVISARARGLGQRSTTTLRLKDGEVRTGLTLNFASTGSLSVRVTSPAGRPMRCNLTLSSEVLTSPLKAVADGQGRYTFHRLKPGPYRLVAEVSGTKSVTLTPEISAGQVTEVTVKLGRTGPLVGKVVDHEGQPVPDAKVSIRWGGGQARVAVDAAGSFTWSRPDVPVELVEVAAASPRHQPSAWSRSTSGDPLVLRLGPGGYISGRVVDLDGQPISPAMVQVLEVDIGGDPPAPARLPMVLVQTPEGRFKLGPLRPGQYRVRGESQRHSSTELHDLVVSAGQDSTGHELVLGRGCRVTGSVRTDSGDPLVGAVIHLVVPGSKMGPRRTATGVEGAFSLAGVPSGRFTLRVTKQGFLTSLSSGVECQSDEVIDRQVELRRARKGEKFAFQGIGATLAQRGTAVVIRALVPDSPALGSGLRVGDRILAVDGRKVGSFSLASVVEMIRGEPGSSVELSIERGGSQQMITIERGQVVLGRTQKKAP